MFNVFITTFLQVYDIKADEHNETLDRLQAAHDTCQKNPKTHITDEDAIKMLKNEPLPQSAYAGYVTCVSNILKTQKPNGNADVHHIKDIFAKVIGNKQEADKFFNNNCSVNDKDQIEVARRIYVCFHDMLIKYGYHS